MRLLDLHIQNFGTLRDFSLTLDPGLNVLYRENGWGKTTLAVFIKAMLYGLPATSKRSLDENERKKYTPWQGGAYGGSISFETEKGAFRAERFFGAKESGDSFALYDLATGLESHAYSRNLGVELFGIDADGYERTVYLSQRGILTKGENYSITAKLGDLLDDVDDIGGYDAAAEVLDRRYKYYVTTGNRGRIAVLEAEQARREREREELLRVRGTLEAREREEEQNARAREKLSSDLEEVRERLRRAGEANARKALLAERARMAEELSALTARHTELEARLEGHHPDEETLQNAALAVVRMRELSARLREIPEEAEVTTELLPPVPVKALPREERIRALGEANGRLRSLGERLSSLSSHTEGEINARFGAGVPEEEALREGFETVKAHAGLEGRGKKGFTAWVAINAAVSLVLAVLTFVLGGNGIAIAALGISLCTLCIGCMAVHKRAQAARRTDEALLRVRRFLKRYGMGGEDLYRDLTALSLMRQEYLKAQAERESRERECTALKKEYVREQAGIKRGFAELGIVLPERSDYTEELGALVRDVARIVRAHRETLALRERRQTTEAELEACRKTLKELIPRIGGREGQEVMGLIDSVGRMETEFCLISSQIDARRAALEDFDLQHPALLEATEGICEDSQQLSEKERALSEQLHGLSEEGAALKTQIERLSIEADRLPECEAALFALGEELSEARENSETVKATLKFLEDAKVGLSTRYLDGMQKSLATYLSYLYPTAEDAVMNASFEVTMRAEGKTRDTDFFSRGQRDVIGLCTRLSLADALYGEGEKPCLVLDDPFINLDDGRLEEAKQLLDRLADSYQIIYMVCHTGRE